MAFEHIIFLQEHQAAHALHILDEGGAQALCDYLKQWHYPGEHDTSDTTAAGSSDHHHQDGHYRLSWNTLFETVSLEYDITNPVHPTTNGA